MRRTYSRANATTVVPRIRGKTNTIFNLCPQGYEMTVERFGKLRTIHRPGWFIAIPLIDRIAHKVDTREIVIDVEPQSGYTKDNVATAASGTIYLRITDTMKACYEVQNVLYAIVSLAQSSMRSAIGDVDLDTLNHDRNRLNTGVRDAMIGTTQQWGAHVIRFELQKVIYDEAVQKAMDKQAVAERVRREQVLAAEADKTSSQRRSEGEMQAIMNIAEGRKQQVLLAAQAKKEAIETIASALDRAHGDTAMHLELATKYIELMTGTIEKAKMNTLFLPDNVMDIGKMLGGSMAILDNIKRSDSKHMD